MKEYLTVATVIKPQGIKGELKVYPMVDDENSLKKLKSVIIAGVTYDTISWRINVGGCFLAIKEINDRNKAETLRNAEITVKREDLVLPDDRMYIADIIGLIVKTDDGKTVGTLKDVLKAKTDVFVVETTDGELMFPSVKGLIKDVDYNGGAITLDAERFKEISTYAD